MANFRVILNIDIEAENPLEAAKELERWSKEFDTHLSYYVQNEDTKEISSVDLDAEDEDAILGANNNIPIKEAFNNLW
jgi:hypothetical protein